MTERLVIEYEGEPNGLRRELRNAFRFVERQDGQDPVIATVTLTIRDQPATQRSATMATTRMRSDQFVDIDVDFQGRLSGESTDVDVEWDYLDPDDVATFMDARDGDDKSKARVTGTPGRGGIVTASWTTVDTTPIVKGSHTVEIEGEGIVLSSETGTVGDQPSPETPAA